MDNNRIEWVDSWKGILILLVVTGHVVGAASHFSTGSGRIAMEYIYKLIYMFHMPAFFFLSGIMWRSKNEFVPFVRKKAFRLLIPYLIFGVISIMLFSIFAAPVAAEMQGTGSRHYAMLGNSQVTQQILSLIHGGGWPHGEGFRCNSVLWFLVCMFSVSVSYYLIDHFFRNKWVQCALMPMFIALDCHLRSSGSFHYIPWGISRAPEFLVFVILGRWWNCKDVVTLLKSRFVYILVSTVCYCVLVWFLKDVWSKHLHDMPYRVWFVAIAWFAIVLSMAWAQTFSCRLLKMFGFASIGIMLVHKPILVALQIRVGVVLHAYRAGNILTTILMSLCVVALVSLVSLAVSQLLLRFFPICLGERKR